MLRAAISCSKLLLVTFKLRNECGQSIAKRIKLIIKTWSESLEKQIGAVAVSIRQEWFIAAERLTWGKQFAVLVEKREQSLQQSVAGIFRILLSNSIRGKRTVRLIAAQTLSLAARGNNPICSMKNWHPWEFVGEQVHFQLIKIRG